MLAGVCSLSRLELPSRLVCERPTTEVRAGELIDRSHLVSERGRKLCVQASERRQIAQAWIAAGWRLFSFRL